jgi:hypothetical protein
MFKWCFILREAKGSWGLVTTLRNLIPGGLVGLDNGLPKKLQEVIPGHSLQVTWKCAWALCMCVGGSGERLRFLRVWTQEEWVWDSLDGPWKALECVRGLILEGMLCDTATATMKLSLRVLYNGHMYTTYFVLQHLHETGTMSLSILQTRETDSVRWKALPQAL